MLNLNNHQRQTIGLDHILHQLAPTTPYGRQKLQAMAPYTCAATLNRHFDNIEKLTGQNTQPLRDILSHFKNIRGILSKLADSPLNEVELFETKGFLLTFERFMPIITEINARLQLSHISFVPMAVALDILDPKKSRIAPFSLLEFSDILAKCAASCPPNSSEATIAEELRIMTDLSDKLRPHIPAFNHNIHNLGQLDLTMAKAALAARHNCVRPKISQTTVALQDMTNPMIAAALAEHGRAITPVSLTLEAGKPTIITGANMGGKSVAIKTAALNVALCGLGLFAFAAKAEIPLFDGIFLVSQDLQSAAAGLSSFGGEVASLNTLAARLPHDFLFIALDEPARATNPAEGAAIVRAIATWLADCGSVSLLSTHYDNITAQNAKYYRVAGLTNLPQNLEESDIADHMDYRLIETTAADPIPKDALKICRLMGLDDNLMTKIEEEYKNPDRR